MKLHCVADVKFPMALRLTAQTACISELLPAAGCRGKRQQVHLQ